MHDIAGIGSAPPLAKTAVEGQVVYELTLTNAGNVDKIIILNSNIDHAILESCIESNILNWKFPTPKKGEAVVKLVFYFKLRGITRN